MSDHDPTSHQEPGDHPHQPDPDDVRHPAVDETRTATAGELDELRRSSIVDDDRDPVGSVAPGDVVAYRYVDRYSGHGDAEVTAHALVLAVRDADEPDEDGNTQQVVTVAIFDQVSELPAGDLEAT